MTTDRTIQDALAAPFEPSEVKFKPTMVKNNRCLAIAYVSARTVMDRLDDALGVGNWEATYRPIDGGVVCTLRVRINGEWTTHEDVGGASEQPDEGDRVKASFSDALKRAAVHVGVARYLYRLPATWVDYDPVKKQITQLPQMPAFGIPKAKAATPSPKPTPPAATGPGPGGQHRPPTQGATEEQRALRTREFAAAATKAGFDRVCAEVAADVKAGRLTDHDRQVLLGVADQALARLKAATAGGAR